MNKHKLKLNILYNKHSALLAVIRILEIYLVTKAFLLFMLAPSPPTNIVLKSNSSHCVIMTWDPPMYPNGKSIKRYEVRVSYLVLFNITC